MFRIAFHYFVRYVEQEIVSILRRRYEDCCWTNFEEKAICADLFKTFNEVSTAYFIKCKNLRNSTKLSIQIF